MSTGNPFGVGLPANLRPEDIAAILSRMPMGPAQGFTQPDAPQADQAPIAQPQASAPAQANPLPPARPPGFAPPSVPAPDPLSTTGAIPSAIPTAPARAPAGPADAGGEGGGFLKGWKALADSGLGDQALAFGSGLLSAPGGEGWGKAFDNLSRVSATSATTDLAKQKLAQEQAKSARDTAGENATRQYLLGKGFDPNLATAAMSSPTVLQSVLSQMNKDPSVVEIAGKKYSLKPGEKPTDSNLLGDATADNSLRLLSTPEDRQAAGIQPNDTRTARIDSSNKVTFDPTPPAPTVHILEDENGNKHIRQYDPKTGGWIDPAQPPGAPPPATNPLALKGKTTGDQSKAAGFSDRMLNSERILATNAQEGSSFKERALNSIPLIGNYLTSDSFQSYDQAKRDFANAQLRRESGAAIGKDEFASADKQYFPQPGDSEATAKQKATNRRISIEAMGREAGTTYLPSHVFDDSGALVPFAPGQRRLPAAQPAGQAGAAPPTQDAPPKIVQLRSADEYAAAPSGTRFISPDGKVRVKP